MLSSNNTDPCINITSDKSAFPGIDIKIVENNGVCSIKITDVFNGKNGSPSCDIAIYLPESTIDLNINTVKSNAVLKNTNINELRYQNVKGSLKVMENVDIQKIFLKLVSTESDIIIGHNLTVAKIDLTSGITKINATNYTGGIEYKSVGTKTIINNMAISGNLTINNNSLDKSNLFLCKAVGGNFTMNNYNFTKI